MNDVEYFLHENASGFALSVFGGDRAMDSETDGMTCNGIGIATENVERTIDGKRNDGESDFVGKGESTFLEFAHLSVVGARSFWEDDHRHAFSQCLLCLNNGFLHGGATVAHVDVSRLCAGKSNEWNLAQIFLHHPLEVVPQIAVDEEDVEIALVIGKEHVRLMGIDELFTFRLDRDEENPEREARPPLGQVISYIDRIAAEGSNGDTDGHDDGDYQEEWERDE